MAAPSSSGHHILAHAAEHEVRDRARACVTGAVVADASTAAAVLAAVQHVHVELSTPGISVAGAVVKLPALAARSSGHKEYMHNVLESIRATCDTDEAVTWVSWFARVLEAVILGATVTEAVRSNLRHLDQPYRAAVESVVTAAQHGETPAHLGTPCTLGHEVPLIIFLLLQGGGRVDFTSLMAANAAAGGDVAGRALLLGAVAGAVASVPDALIAGCAVKDDLVRVLAAGVHEPVTMTMATDHVEVHPHSARAHS